MRITSTIFNLLYTKNTANYRERLDMSYYDEKPKNTFGDGYGEYKEKNDYGMYRERGGCLSFFIGWIVVVNAAVILLMIAAMGGANDTFPRNAGTYQMLFMLQIGMSVALIACAFGLWNWKQWGYTGLLILYGISAALNLLSGAPQFVVGSLVGLAILYGLMKDKTQWLE
jgi:hypothetical protein